jgi:hypothetical protein
MRIPSPGFLASAFVQVCKRFPGTMLCTLLGTIACFALVDTAGIDNEQFYARNWMTCQLGLPLLTALVVYSESKTWSTSWAWLLQGLGFVALVGCWYWLDTNAENFDQQIVPQYMALQLVLHLAVAVAPFLNTRPVRDFWEYNRQLFANFVVGAAFTLILYVGLALAVLAVEMLFDLEWPDKIYGKLFILLAGVFNTSYFLYHFPQKYSSESTEGNAYSWVFRNLCKYILIPIVLLYFVILYAYGAKVGLEWSLPKGWISSLVLGFSVAGIFTYLLNFYLAEEDSSLLVKGFKKWFWWVLLPLTALLFIAIGKRIGDYGVTEERFLVAQLGVWLAVACLYFLLSKNDNIKFIPISLGLFALVWAFGPLSAFSVSERSQKGILTGILERNGRFEAGKMKPGTALLTEPEREQVSSTLYYLARRNCLSELLPLHLDSLRDDSGGIMNWLKIESSTTGGRLTISIQASSNREPLEIRGFDIGYPVNLDTPDNINKSEAGNQFVLSEDGTQIEWWQVKDGSSSLVESFSIATALYNWGKEQKPGQPYTYMDLPISDRSFQFIGKKGSIKWVVESATVEILDHKKRLNSSYGWILLKEKSSTQKQ